MHLLNTINKQDIPTAHGHVNFPVGSVGWHFHHKAHGELVHCEGGAKNPYKIIHIGKKHGINKEYARGHGINTAPQWFKFEKKISDKQYDLLSGVKVETEDVPDKFKIIASISILRKYETQISRKVALKLKECTAFMKDHGLFKGGIGDIETISDELWRELWNKFIDSTDPLVKKFNKELIPPFDKQEKEVLANIKKHPPTTSAITDEKGWRLDKETCSVCGVEKAKLTPTQERFIDLWMFDQKKWAKEFAVVGEPNITGGVFVGGTAALDAVESTIPFSITEAETAKFISTQSLKYAKEINKTTEKILRTKLTAALQSGDSVVNVTRKIKKDVNAIYTFSKQSRAKMIAQTEMIGAVNKGSLEGSKQSGVVWGNQWLSALDDLVRDDHVEEHGETAALGEEFPTTGLEYPGDSSGEASQIVNCRCSLKPLTKKPR